MTDYLKGEHVAFNLDTLIIEELANHASPDPHVVSYAVANRIPKSRLAEVVAQLLQHEVRQKVRQQRNFGGGLTQSDKWAGLGEASHADSWRVPVEDGWKFFPDMTAEDCEYIAQTYEKRAAANKALAERFWRLALRLRRAGVETIRDLPPDDTDEEAA